MPKTEKVHLLKLAEDFEHAAQRLGRLRDSSYGNERAAWEVKAGFASSTAEAMRIAALTEEEFVGLLERHYSEMCRREAGA